MGQATYTSGSAIFVDTSATRALKNSIITDYTDDLFVAGTLNEGNNFLFNDTCFARTGTINHGGHSQFQYPVIVNSTQWD